MNFKPQKKGHVTDRYIKKSIALEAEYQKYQFINQEQSYHLANRLNMDPGKVRNWFQNRRRRNLRKFQRENLKNVEKEYMKQFTSPLKRKEDDSQLKKVVQEAKKICRMQSDEDLKKLMSQASKLVPEKDVNDNFVSSEKEVLFEEYTTTKLKNVDANQIRSEFDNFSSESTRPKPVVKVSKSENRSTFVDGICQKCYSTELSYFLKRYRSNIDSETLEKIQTSHFKVCEPYLPRGKILLCGFTNKLFSNFESYLEHMKVLEFL